MYAITGASGQLGRLVIEALLREVPAGRIVAAARDLDKVGDLADLGVIVRRADYDRPGTLAAAFDGVDKLLLISSSEVGRRTPQHRAVIAAAQAAGVNLIAYTSLLHAATSDMILASEHRETEAILASAGVPYVILRNGWYSENHLGGLPAALAHNVLLGSAKDGRIASAPRADYAAAAVAVLTADEDQAGRTYELAGDEAWTLTDLAAEISRQTGKRIAYDDLPEAAYAQVLQQSGMPEPMAKLLADADRGASKGQLFDATHSLSRLLKRPTVPIPDTVAAALHAQR